MIKTAKRVIFYTLLAVIIISIPSAVYAQDPGTGVKSAACGVNITGIITNDDTLYMTGDITHGGTGLDVSSDYVTRPRELMKDVLQVSTNAGIADTYNSRSVTAILKKDGTLWTTGENYYGQLGDGTNEDKKTPVYIANNVAQVSCGGAHIAFVKKDGSLWVTGNNGNGQLGNGSSVDENRPVKIMDNVKQVSCGTTHTAILKKDGSLWMTGSNRNGQLGDESTFESLDPIRTPIKIRDNVKCVECGSYHTAFIDNKDDLYTFGRNTHYELGDTTNHSKSTPGYILSDVAQVSCGFSHTCAVKKDGTLWAMGSNSHGEVNVSKNTYHLSKPKQILEDVKYVSCGHFHTAIIKKDGSLWTCGYNASGQLGNGSSLQNWGKLSKVMEGTSESDQPEDTVPDWTVDDEWNFGNYIAKPIELTDTDYKKLVKYDTDWKYNYYVENLLNTSGENGVCFGFAVSSIIAKNRTIFPETFTNGCKTIHQAKSSNKYAKSAIGYYQLSQDLSKKYILHRFMFIQTHSTKESQIKAILDVLDQNTPCLVSITGDWGAHAVVATGVKYDSTGYTLNGRDEFNARKYDGMIEIYDSSNYEDLAKYPDKADKIRLYQNLYFNTETYDWEIPYYLYVTKDFDTTSELSYIQDATGDVDLLNYKGYGFTDSEYKAMIRIKTNGETTFNSPTRSRKIGKGEVWSDDQLIFYDIADNSGSGHMMNIMIKNPEEYYSFMPEGSEKLELCALYPECLVSATADSYEYADAFLSGSIFVSKAKGHYSLSMVTDDSKWKAVTIEGNDPEYLRVDDTNKGVEIAAENLDDAVLIIKNEDSTLKGKINTDSQQILVTSNDREVKVWEDTDLDGTYDLDITPEFIDPTVTRVTTGTGTFKIISDKKATFVKAKNKKSIVIPAAVKIGGKKYKVSQIESNAFKAKNIRTVTVGKNVTTIKSKAFSKSKATKIIVKSKLLKKVKGSLKGSKIKKIQVKVGKKSLNKKYIRKYKKFFTKKNAGKSVKVCL